MIPQSTRARCALLFLIGCALYAGSLGHEWAFDDPLVYNENPAVQEGFSGVPRILTSDSYAHLYERMGRPVELSGGRYRPLSLITFALEHELFGNVPLVAHLGNVFLYGLTLPILFLLLVKWLPDRPRWALVAVILFAVHPIHTEVVANVKSRDEILSLLFLLASLLFLWRAFEIRQRRVTAGPPGVAPVGEHEVERGVAPRGERADPEFSNADLERSRSWVSMTLSGACALLALLSKEYAVSLLLLAPAMLFVFAKTPLRASVRFAWPIVVAVAAYLWLRISAVGLHRVEAVDLLNDPYLLATPAQTWATKLFVLLQYLRLLIWPDPLSADYSYRHFAYRDFQDPLVWVAVVALIAGIGFAWRGVRRRHWAGFAALFFLAHLLLISNFVVEIGAMMGERLLYHPSIGFAMLLSGILTWAGSSSVSKENGSRLRLSRLAMGSNALLGAIVAAGVCLTLLRVPDWRNDVTLFTHDVEVVPESARANANAGRGFLLLSDESTETARKEALLERAEVHLEKAIEIDPEIVMAYFTLGAVHDRRGEYEAMERSLNQARQRFPDHPSFATYDPILADRLARWAVDAAQTGDDGQARRLLERAVGLDPDQASLWYYLGIARRADGDLPEAIDAWEQALRLDPTLEQASEALRRSQAPAPLPRIPERGSIER